MKAGKVVLDCLVQSARTVDQPAAQAKERVWQRLAPALGVGGVAGAATISAVGGPETASGTSNASAPLAAGTKIGVTLLAAGVLGAAALVLWRSPSETIPRAPMTSGIVRVLPRVEASQASERTAPARSASEPSAPASSLPAVRTESERPAKRARESTPRPKDSLADELALLRSAKVALDEGRAARALTLLEQYDRRFPGGKLVNEARATQVLALCAAGNTAAARAQASRLDPRSPLAKKLKTGCVGR